MEAKATLRYHGKEKGMSREEAALALDIFRQTAYRWESETSIPEMPLLPAGTDD